MIRNSVSATSHPRRGWVVKGPLVVLGLLMIGVPLVWSFLPRALWHGNHDRPLTTKVIRGDFINEVTERGDVESASNVEVRCEVESQGSGVMIIRIVPEGTYVQPGDFLVELDSSALRDQYVQQQIKVANEQALLIQAQRALDTALIAKQEYLEGQYRQQLLEIQIENFIAEENRRRAEDYLKYSQSLAQKGYITQAQLEADQFALNKAIKELESARTKLDVLERFTKVKSLKQLDADIETARAKLEAQQHSYELQVQELKKIEEQIKKCVITAPVAGQVVYANQVGVRGQTDVIIQEGVRVRQYQTIIRLPDPKRMQVKTKVNESKIGLVRVGLPAKIRVDALAGVEFDGEVTEVGEYPLPTSFFNSNVKDYQVVVKINNPTEDLRSGLTAQVTILAQREPNVLQVPVQSVFEVAGEFYCITLNPDGSLQPVKVEIGPSNEKFVVIRKGLNENQEVILNAAAYREKVGLAEKNEPVLASWSRSQGEQATAAQEAAAKDAEARKMRFPASPDAQAQRSPGEGPGEATSGGAAGRPPFSGGPGGEGPGGMRPPGGFNPAMIVDRIFERMDTNKDGKLDPSEIPEDRRTEFMQSDTNGDGAIDKQELLAGFERMRAAGGFPGGFGRRGGPDGGPPRPGNAEAQ
ncbi:efflux RND transporter periplasmic adaptor subunit [Thermogutta sp.]|uniref:efflux RND transporter periplasmic adaptor subunit n=1 Tax=Thermogutta sp. TaxID=1962930 RepID=UPI00321F9508